MRDILRRFAMSRIVCFGRRGPETNTLLSCSEDILKYTTISQPFHVAFKGPRVLQIEARRWQPEIQNINSKIVFSSFSPIQYFRTLKILKKDAYGQFFALHTKWRALIRNLSTWLTMQRFCEKSQRNQLSNNCHGAHMYVPQPDSGKPFYSLSGMSFRPE